MSISSDFTRISAIAVSPAYASDHTVFVFCYGDYITEIGKAYKSTDGGVSFALCMTGLPSSTNFSVGGAAISPNFATDHTVFVSLGSDKVYKTTDGGGSWSSASTGISATSCVGIVISPNYASDAAVFVTAYSSGVFRTTDGGSNWSEISTGLPMLWGQALAISPNFASDTTLYFGTWDSVSTGGIYKSLDAMVAVGGPNWSAVNTGIADKNIANLAMLCPPNLSSGVLAAVDGVGTDGAYKTINGGTSWSAVLPTVPAFAPTYVYALATCPDLSSDDLTAFAGSDDGSGIFKTVDAGASWNPYNSGLPNSGGVSCSAIAMSPAFTSDGVVFAAVKYYGLYKSTDYGYTWFETGQPPVGVLAITTKMATVEFHQPGSVGQLYIEARIPRLVLTGGSAVSGQLNIIAKLPTISLSSVESPFGYLNVKPKPARVALTGYIPSVGVLNIKTKPARVNLTGYVPAVGSLNIKTVMPRLQLWYLVYTSETRAIVLNTETMSVVEYDNFPFTSFAEYEGKIYAAGPDGLYVLEGTDDDGTKINALGVPGLLDFGTTNLKRVDDVIMDFEGPGMKITAFDDGENTVGTRTVVSSLKSGVHTERWKPGRGAKSRAWGFKFENVNGGELSLKDIEARLDILPRKVS